MLADNEEIGNPDRLEQVLASHVDLMVKVLVGAGIVRRSDVPELREYLCFVDPKIEGLATGDMAHPFFSLVYNTRHYNYPDYDNPDADIEKDPVAKEMNEVLLRLDLEPLYDPSDQKREPVRNIVILPFSRDRLIELRAHALVFRHFRPSDPLDDIQHSIARFLAEELVKYGLTIPEHIRSILGEEGVDDVMEYEQSQRNPDPEVGFLIAEIIAAEVTNDPDRFEEMFGVPSVEDQAEYLSSFVKICGDLTQLAERIINYSRFQNLVRI